MPDIEWTKILTLAVTSGAIAGLVNQVAGFARDWLTRRSTTKEGEKARDFTAEAQSRDLQHKAELAALDIRNKAEMQDRELAHQRQMLAEQRENADRERQDAAHSKASSRYLEHMADFVRWCDAVFIEQGYASDVDYVAAHFSQPKFVTTPVAAIDFLRSVGDLHPTRFVRDAAHKLSVDLDDKYNMYYGGDDVGDPTREDLLRWMRRGKAIIEGIHDPRPLSPLIE